MAPVISARDLYKCYAGFAPVLRGVNIDVEAGEMVAIMGPSGCGKSTMLHVLGMLHAPDSGSLEILGTNVLTLNREQTAEFRRGNMGFVMQASNLFDHSTVFENVEFPLIYENVPPQERWERVIRALDLVRLSNRVHYRSNRLSGGEQQRVAIARAMVNNPRILLADEPTGALDAKTSRLIMENFRTLCHSGGVAMVMVTHDPKMADFCDSIYTLDEGLLNCKKHEPSPFAATGNEGFLKPPEPLVRGAFVASRFPATTAPDLPEIAAALHGQGLLARIYALGKTSFFKHDDSYSLPLAVREIGFWSKLARIMAILSSRHKNLRQLLKELPSPFGHHLWEHLKSLACGSILAAWSKEDSIEFLYAASAGAEATASWTCARLQGLPFAFAIRGKDLASFGPEWTIKAHDAVFVACPTKAVQTAVGELLPLLPPEKIVLLREPLEFTPSEEDLLPSIPEQKALPPVILAVWPDMEKNDFKNLLLACAQLKKEKVEFKLKIAGPKNFGLKWRIFRAGLGRQIIYSGIPTPDNISDIYKSADIFVISPRKKEELLVPMPVREAMAFGLAILTDGITPGLSEVLQKARNCMLYTAGSRDDLAAKLANLAADAELRKKLGTAARRDILALLDDCADVKKLEDLIVAAAGQIEKRKDRMISMDRNGN